MTSTTPPVLMWLAIEIIFLSVAVRVIAVERSVINRRMNTVMFLYGMVAVTRAPAVQNLIAPLVPSIAIVRPVTHALAMCAAVAIYDLASAWSSQWRQRRSGWWRYGAVAALVAAMFVFSHASRVHGVTLEQYGTWRVLAYHVCYSTPPVLAFGTVAVILVRDWNTVGTLRGKITSVAALVLVTVSLFDNLFRPFAALFDSLGVHDSVTELRSESNDALFLPPVVALAVLITIPAWRRIVEQRSWRHWRDLCSRLAPMWSSVTGAVPAVVAGAVPRAEGSSRRRLQRMVINIRDSTLIIEGFPPMVSSAVVDQAVSENSRTPAADWALRRAILLLSSIRAMRSGTRSGTDVESPPMSATAVAGKPTLAAEVQLLLPIADCWGLAQTIESALHVAEPRAVSAAEATLHASDAH